MVQRATIHHHHPYRKSRIISVVLVTSFWLGWRRGKTLVFYSILSHFSQNDISFWSLCKHFLLSLHGFKSGPRGKEFFLFSCCFFTQSFKIILLNGTSPASPRSLASTPELCPTEKSNILAMLSVNKRSTTRSSIIL